MKTMPSFSESLEKTLHNALKAASERHHEYATLEHLLYALIDDDHGAEVMRACGVALDDLQSAVVHYLDTELDSLKVEGPSDPAPPAASSASSSARPWIGKATCRARVWKDCSIWVEDAN